MISSRFHRASMSFWYWKLFSSVKSLLKKKLAIILRYSGQYFWLPSNVFWWQLQILFKNQLTILERLLGSQSFFYFKFFLWKHKKPNNITCVLNENVNWFFSITDSMTLLVIASSGWHLALYIVICYRNQGQNRKQEKLKITTQYISRFLTFLSRNVVVAINCCLLSSCSKIARRFLNNICNCHQNMLLRNQK